MPPPDFNKKTIETLAKRAAFKCSNPDCRVSTVGPNSDPLKSTLIGEAAHIFGARPKSKRYKPKMTDTSRAEITNSIWLCRNCHKLIDTDEEKFSSNILFAWREQHEMYIQSELDSIGNRIQFEEQNSRTLLFENCPPIVRRIVIDKPPGWEWRLTAELMRHFNQPHFRRFSDISDGLYFKPKGHVYGENVTEWVRLQINELIDLIKPIVHLFDRLSDSWGRPGEPGNEKEIFHITSLIRDFLEQVVNYEEKIHFTSVPEEYVRLINLLKDLLSFQAEKIAEIPDFLDEIVDSIGTDHEGTDQNPLEIKKILEFELPENWNKEFDLELDRVERYQRKRSGTSNKGGCFYYIIGGIIFYFIASTISC